MGDFVGSLTSFCLTRRISGIRFALLIFLARQCSIKEAKGSRINNLFKMVIIVAEASSSIRREMDLVSG